MALDKNTKGRFYEGCGKEGPILSIFICEFHPTYGPKISCQVPKEFISKETFESVNVYLIPKPQLIRCIITVTLDDIKMVGYPELIKSQVYPRNAFYYNVCFVCNSWARTVQYDQVVKDFSTYLLQLEEDERLLSRMEETEARVTALLSQVLDDLNSSRTSTVQEGRRRVRLKAGRRSTRAEVSGDSVPMLASATYQHPDHSTVSLVDKILQHVDGLNDVERIANLSSVDLNRVKLCIQSLMNDCVLKLVPHYSDTNCYLVTSGVSKLVMDRQVQADCLSAVSLRGGGGLPTVRDVLTVYSSLNQGSTVRDICYRFDLASMRISEKLLIQFGLLHGFIRKLDKFVNRMTEDEGKTGGAGVGSREDFKLVLEKLDGKSCLDRVAAEAGVSVSQLQLIVETDCSLVTIAK